MNSTLNTPQTDAVLKLFPMVIPGWRTPVLPAGVYHGGIPRSIHSPLIPLYMVIDPVTTLATTLAIGDSVEMWVNGKPTSVIKVIKKGEENDRFEMELPWGLLLDGANTLFYRVTRPSQNFDDSTPVLDVLVHTPVSDIKVSHPARVGPGQPATFTLTRNYPREHDAVKLIVGTLSKTIPYNHPANPITYTLTAAECQQIGYGSHLVEATVTDQLGNRNVSVQTTITLSDWQDDYTDFENGFNGWIPHNAARSGSIRVLAGQPAFFNFTDQLPATGFRGTVLYKDFLCPAGSYVFQMKACHVADNPAAGLLNPLLQLQVGIAGGDGDVREVPKNGIWYDFRLSINVPAQGIVRFYIQNHQDGSHGNDFGIDDIQVTRTSGMGGVMGVLNEAPRYPGPVTPITLI